MQIIRMPKDPRMEGVGEAVGKGFETYFGMQYKRKYDEELANKAMKRKLFVDLLEKNALEIDPTKHKNIDQAWKAFDKGEMKIGPVGDPLDIMERQLTTEAYLSGGGDITPELQEKLNRFRDIKRKIKGEYTLGEQADVAGKKTRITEQAKIDVKTAPRNVAALGDAAKILEREKAAGRVQGRAQQLNTLKKVEGALTKTRVRATIEQRKAMKEDLKEIKDTVEQRALDIKEKDVRAKFIKIVYDALDKAYLAATDPDRPAGDVAYKNLQTFIDKLFAVHGLEPPQITGQVGKFPYGFGGFGKKEIYPTLNFGPRVDQGTDLYGPGWEVVNP